MYSKEGGAENGISSRVSIDVRMERDVEGRRGSREPPVSLRVSACNTCVCVCVCTYIYKCIKPLVHMDAHNYENDVGQPSEGSCKDRMRVFVRRGGARMP